MSGDKPPSDATVRAAAETFKSALDAHLTAVEQRAGENDPDVQETYDRLRDAGLAYDDLLFDTYEEVTPFEAPDPDVDEPGEVAPGHGPAARVALLTRHDYAVLDHGVLLDAGREAYRETWPDEGEEVAEQQVSHLGAALYELANAYGVDGMDDRAEDAGLEPEGSTTWVLDVGDVGERWRDVAFTSAGQGRVLYRLDEVYDEDGPDESDDDPDGADEPGDGSDDSAGVGGPGPGRGGLPVGG
jgi:hypothetical protein